MIKHNRNWLDRMLPMKTCAICGKEFITSTEWLYKLNYATNSKSYKYKYFCSYTCYRKAGGDNGRKSRKSD